MRLSSGFRAALIALTALTGVSLTSAAQADEGGPLPPGAMLLPPPPQAVTRRAAAKMPKRESALRSPDIEVMDISPCLGSFPGEITRDDARG